MGTRGTYGFYKNGVTKATYNHSDSYPSELGVNVTEFIIKNKLILHEIFNMIKMVNENDIPTKEQIEHSLKYYNSNVSFGQNDDWYCLLRNAQGDLNVYNEGLEFMIDGGADFLKDSLFCEWGYIINLDEGVLEVYKGFQQESEKNRYYDLAVERNDYKNCKLIAKFDFNDLDDFENKLMAIMEETGED